MLKKGNYYKVLSLSFLWFCSLAFPSPGLAADLGMKPSHTKDVNLNESLKPGEEKEFEFTLINLTQDQMTVSLEVKDLEKTLDSGEYVFKPFSDTDDNVQLSGLISLKQEKITLTPGQRKTIFLSINIPGSIQPGEYLGGLVATNSQTDRELALSKLDLVIEGSLSKSLEASLDKEINQDKLTLVFNLKNTGNTKIDGLAINSKIKNTKLEKILNLERVTVIPFDSFILPGQTITLKKELAFELDPIGFYFLEAEINYGGNQPEKLKQSFSHNSVKKIIIWGGVSTLGLTLIIFLSLKFLKWYLKKRKQAKTINDRWNRVVNDLLEGKSLENSLDEKTLQKITGELKQEITKSIKQEIKKSEENITKKIKQTSRYVKENIEISKLTLARQSKTSPKYLIYMGKKDKNDYKSLMPQNKKKQGNFFFKRIKVDKEK